MAQNRAAHLTATGIVDTQRGRRFERFEAGPEAEGKGRQADECAQAAEPALAADFRTQIGCHVDIADARGKVVAQVGPGKPGTKRRGQDLVMRKRNRRLAEAAVRCLGTRFAIVPLGPIHA